MSQETDPASGGRASLALHAYEEEAIPERDPLYYGWIWDNHVPGTLNPHDEVTMEERS